LNRHGLVVALATVMSATATAAQGVDPVAATRALLQREMTRARRAPRAALVAREAFLERSAILEVRLAPNGQHLSFLRRSDQGVDLMMQAISGGAPKRIVAGLRRAETAWAGDGRHLWLADDQGLAVIEPAGLGPRRVLNWDPRRFQRLWAVDARAPQFAIVYERIVQAGAQRHRYLTVDAQGRTRLLLEAAWPLRSALLEAGGALAFAAAVDGPGYGTVIHQHTATGPRELLRCGPLEDCRLVGHSPARGALWLVSQRGAARLALHRWRQATGTWEPIHRDPVGIADADALLWDGTGEDWLAIAYHGARRQWHGNAGGARVAVAALVRQLPEANLHLSTTRDGRLWLVQAQDAARAADRYYLYRPDVNRLQALFGDEDAAAPRPPPGAAMHPVSYRASDGMLLHGYLLLPSGIAPGTAPLIAWLHGGPVARIYDRYDASVQLLANRGYVVFVPNFRGSTGYGLNYLRSANGDVGNGRVLADIIDGLNFLLEQGIGDRAQQAAAGMSFGGYASLLALSHHPERFRFAFAGAPPTEYGWIKQWQAEHESSAAMAEGPPLSLQFPQLGFRYQDAGWRQRMLRDSPLATLAALRAPVYIWAGARDDRVPLKSIAHYVGEARRLGKSVSLLIDPDAGHVPADQLGAEAFLYLLERAAHRHFQGGMSPVAPALQAFMRRHLRIDTN